MQNSYIVDVGLGSKCASAKNYYAGASCHERIWDSVFKSGLSKFCGRQPSKNFKGYSLLKGESVSCLPQNLLRPLFNALSHIDKGMQWRGVFRTLSDI